MIVDELYDYVAPKAKNHSVAEVRIGLGYTAAQLDNGACGMAYTFREEAAEGCCAVREAGALAGRPAMELAGWARKLDSVSAAVGLAVINALIEEPREVLEGDFLEALHVGPDDEVGMVGYFGPLVRELRRRASELHIFERHPSVEPGVLPDWAAPAVLPSCQVAIITATTLLNRTMDSLLQQAEGAREVAILGPSTPLAPEIFTSRHVTVLSGMQATDPGRVLRVVSEGGGTREFGAAVRKVTVKLSGVIGRDATRR